MRARSTRAQPQVDPFVSPRLFSWWFFLAAPMRLAERATYEEREAFRRGRLTSLVLLFELYIIAVITITVGLPSPNRYLLPLLLLLLAALVVATVLNKRNQVRLAGWIAVLAYEFAVAGDILTTPGGLTTFALPLFDLFVQITMIAASLLPLRWLKWIAGAQLVFIVSCILFMQRAPDFAAIAQSAQFPDALLRPVFTNLIAAYGISLWVSGALRASTRADQEKGVAELERQFAQQGQREKEVLESSIAQIVQIHARIAQGDLHARVPVHQGNVLWSIAGGLNTLLNRYQRVREAQQELERTHAAAQQILTAWYESQQHGTPMRFSGQTGTVLDGIVLEWQRCYVRAEQQNAAPVELALPPDRATPQGPRNEPNLPHRVISPPAAGG